MKASYTTHKNVAIDYMVERHMDIIIDEIVKILGHVDSIVLSGGFGRGEGSVRRLPGGGYIPMNDYDVYVFSDVKISENVFRDMLHRIKQRIKNEPSHASQMPDVFDVDIQLVRTSDLSNLNPDMSTFGLKTASKTIWGKNLKDRICMQKRDVPYASVALNVLFQSVMGMMQHFNLDFLQKGVLESNIARLNFECYKVYVAISTSLLLIRGVLELYHLKRAEIFSRHYTNWFPELAEKLPDLPERVTYYTNLKLNSIHFREEKNSIQLWFQARNDLRYVLLYVINELLDEVLDCSSDFCDFLCRKKQAVSFLYFEPYLWYMLKKKGILTASLTIRTSMFMATCALNLNYLKDWYRYARQIWLRPLFSTIPPLTRIFLTSALLLQSLNEQGQIDSASLDRAFGIIKVIYPHLYCKHDKETTWSILKDACLLSYKIISRMEKIVL